MPSAKVELKITCTVEKACKDYLSWCPELDVYSQGDTEEEAENNLVDAARMFVISCLNRGCLNEVLAECGFEAQTNAVEGQEHPISIPLPVGISHRDVQRRR